MTEKRTGKQWTLPAIVQQLASCGYACEAGPLEHNEAFRALARMARENLVDQAADIVGEVFESTYNILDEIVETGDVSGAIDHAAQSLTKRHCCHVGCLSRAEWVITYGPTPDDYTESCTRHVGDLLTDAPEHYLKAA